MKFDYVRIYEENEVKEKYNPYNNKYRIAFVKKGSNCERIEGKDGNSVFYTKTDNTKKYYPQNYKDFLKMFKALKVENGKVNVYEVYSGCLLSHDYKNKNHCYHQDKTTINELIHFAKEYFCDKTLPQEKQIAQKNEFCKRCCMILGEKVGIIAVEKN